MKKAKLFMMLALLVMGVSNVMGETKTKDFFVNYETEFLTGTGYNIDASQSNLITSIVKFENLTSTLGNDIAQVGDRMIRVTYNDNSTVQVRRAYNYYGTLYYENQSYRLSALPTECLSNLLAAELKKCITAKSPTESNYTSNVWIRANWGSSNFLYEQDNNLYYCYLQNNELKAVGGGGNTVYITYQYTGNDTETWTNGIFTYSTLYTKTNTTNVKNTIKLPANQCAIQLNTYTQSEVTIPVKDPQKNYDVVAIQTNGMCENVRHSISMTGCKPNGSTIKYDDAYNNWSNSYLEKVNFAKTSKVRSIADYAFNSCKVLETIEIPQTVEYLGEACFSMCVGLTDGLTFERTSGASFTTGIKVIRNYTFWLCENMTDLELPDGIIVIEGQQSGSSMQYMTSLTHLRLPNTLVAVGPHFLCDASSLPEVTIPASVRYIDGACFHGCESLREVYLLGPASALQGVYDGSDTFGANETLCKEHVQNCVFITTQENISGYVNDPNGVWPLIAGNQVGSCEDSNPNPLKAVKTDEAGDIVRDTYGNLLYETNEQGQPVYLTYADGTTQVTTNTCANWSSNALTYLPDQKVTFTPGKWVTVIFPKAYNQNDLKTTFGNDVVLAKMTGFQTPYYIAKDGKKVYQLNFTAQSAADANTPYMIKPGHIVANDNTPYDVTMIAARDMTEDYRAELSKDHGLSTGIAEEDGTEVVMYGWFKKRQMKLWELYFQNPIDTKTNEYNKHCVFKRIINAADAPEIKAFRCYWRIWLEGEVRDDASAGSKNAFFRFADDDETTGIEQVDSNISIEIGNIYDLNGRKMDLSKENLPKGLFIINGKKVMINK